MNGRLLVCGVNWLGDTLMSMPAVRALAESCPGESITLLVKPALTPLWDMLEAPVSVLPLETGGPGMRATVSRVRAGAFDRAVVLPNSFRSAWIPFRAGVPIRRGAAGRWRRWLLTEIVAGSGAQDHQSLDYYRLLGLPAPPARPAGCRLRASPDAMAWASDRLGTGDRWVALMPGAARGPSKQWPADRFAEVGRFVSRDLGARVVVLGSAAEREAGEQVTHAVEGAVNLVGTTSLPKFAAILARCAGAVTNDSGGMHLAAAMGTRVVAIFGLTDARVTGPLGAGHRVLAATDVVASRDIPRDSAAARRALESISVGCVAEAIRAVLSGDAA